MVAKYVLTPRRERAGRKGRENLVAIWARDTLGLTPGEYREYLTFTPLLPAFYSHFPYIHSNSNLPDRKTQTTKDLTKPWTQLPLTSSLSPSQPHSAKTTLLLDDSPLKAHLQPYNHVCIQEYASGLRGKDLGVRAREVAAARRAQ